MGRKTKENPAHRSFLEKTENQSLEKGKATHIVLFWKNGKPEKVIAAATKDLRS